MYSESAALPDAVPLVRADALAMRDRGVLAVATLAVWSHTADEVRIGEYIAVPAALLTGALLVRWTRMRPASRGVGAVLLGLVWLLGAVPYHVVPLLQGVTVWQNVSGLLQFAGGIPILALGVLQFRRRRPVDEAHEG